MKFTYTPDNVTSRPSALARTFGVWLLSNVGGTALLTLDFNYKYPSDLAVPLMIGLLVALMSLACVPLAWPFFAFAQRTCTGWQCRLLAFYDTAYGKRNHALPGELRSTTIAGAGLGLRFAVGSTASVQLDYGNVVKEGALSGAGKDKLHVRVGLAY